MTAATPRANTPQRRGDTCVARMTAAIPWTNTPHRRGDTCVARMTAAIPRTNTPRRRGDTCVARSVRRNIAICRHHRVHRRTPRAVGATLVSPGRSAAISQFAGTTAYTAQRNATDGSCRSGTGRHKWRPTCIVARRRAATPPAPPRPPRRSAAISWPNIPQRRGDTCVARMTAAISQFAGTTAYTAQRNAADGSCRSGTGRHKWRPYVHCRALSRRNAAGTTGLPRRSAAIPRPNIPRRRGDTCVARMTASGCRKWPAPPRTPPNAMPRTGRAVPAPGVINGAPTCIVARRRVATPPAPPARPVGPPQYRGRYACQGRAKKNGRPCGHVGGNA